MAGYLAEDIQSGGTVGRERICQFLTGGLRKDDHSVIMHADGDNVHATSRKNYYMHPD
jgi:hypothetical protein